MTDNFQINMNEYLPLRDVVFNTLHQAILKGELKPGERLMEIQLAQRLGVSRTPVREAIRKLELEGLVVMVPRKGAEVAAITVEDLVDVLEVRSALEVMAARYACDHITDEQLQELKLAENEFRHSLDNRDITACVHADMKFHELIYSATKNRRLLQILNNLREQMYRYRMEYLKDRGTHKKLLGEHETIYNALKNRDKEMAGEAIRSHIDNQKESMVNSILSKE